MSGPAELKTYPVIRHIPLNTGDALYGGRTETMNLHYKIREGENTIKYVDENSLHPYVCKYFKFKEVLVKCCCIPAKRLPSRVNF